MTTDADRSSFFIALVVVDVLVGLADAISGPYIVLFLVDEARLSPLSLSAILTARALSGIAFGTAFGAWVDRRKSVAPLLLALGGSSLGYALLALTTNFAFLLIIAAVPIALAPPLSPNRSRSSNDNSTREPSHHQSRDRILRASWSLAWAIGPATGRWSRRRSAFAPSFSRAPLGRDRPRDPRFCASEAYFRRGRLTAIGASLQMEV